MTTPQHENTTDNEEVPTTTAPEDQHDPPQEQYDNPNAEAAKYRRKLRDTETELTESQQQTEAQTERISSLQRALIDQHTQTQLHSAQDFWAFAETDLDGLIDEDGLPDLEKVDKVMDQILSERHYLKTLRVPKPDPSAGPSGESHDGTNSVENFLNQKLG